MSGNRGPRIAAASIAAIIASAFGFTSPTANAAAPGPYSGYAHASAVHVDAVTNGATRLVNLDAAVANAAVNSAGLRQTLTAHDRPVIIDDSKLGKKSFASSELVRVGVAGAPSAPGTLVNLPSTATLAAAPGDAPASVELLKQQVSPVANARVLHRSASPVWNGSTCVIGEPISIGTFEAARLELVDTAVNESTANFDKELIGIVSDSAGPDRAAVNQVSLTQLYEGSGEGFGLMAATMSTIAPVTLFEGTDNEITIELLGPAVLRAMADGTSGGAKVEFDAPAVSVIQDGVRQVILPDDPLEVIEVPTDGGGVLQIRIGQLDVSQRAANGTSAVAKGAVLTVKVAHGVQNGLKGATIAIGHVEAAVNVPAGGITCALRVDVEATPPAVGAGKSVEVTTTVYNDYDCPLQQVVLVDTLTTEDDATFTITDAPDAVRKSGGTRLRTGSIEWLIPSIAPKSSASRTFTVRLDTGAGKLNINGIADGKLANCATSPGGDDATVAGLGKASANVGGSSGLVVPVSRVLGGGIKPGDNLPTTGVASAAFAGFALLGTAGGLAAGLRRRR